MTNKAVSLAEEDQSVTLQTENQTMFKLAFNDSPEVLALQHEIRTLCLELSPISARQIIPENILLPSCMADQLCGPAFLEILPTDICNQGCNWCFTASSRSRRTLQADQLRKRLDLFIAGGGKAILFSGGGEPLLYQPLLHATPEFDGQTVIEWLANRNISIGLITNGVFLEQFINANSKWTSTLAFIRVSLDACNPAEYALRHCVKPSDFKRSTDGIKAAIASRAERSTPAVGVSFVIDGNSGMNSKFSDINTIQKWTAELGVDYAQLKHIHIRKEEAADALMQRISKWIGEFEYGQPEYWVHRYLSSRASSHCRLPLAGQLLRADGARSPCCHLQGKSVPEQDTAAGFSLFTVQNCSSSTCRYVSMNRLLENMGTRLTDHIKALLRLKQSLEKDGFHPYRLFPSAPDLATSYQID